MRRDVRILLVGDGMLLPVILAHSVPVAYEELRV